MIITVPLISHVLTSLPVDYYHLNLGNYPDNYQCHSDMRYSVDAGGFAGPISGDPFVPASDLQAEQAECLGA